MKKITTIVFFILLDACCGQQFAVHGTVMSPSGRVRYASVIYTNQADTTITFKTVTDTMGMYSIDILTSITDRDRNNPKKELLQNYPNPFSGATTIAFTLSGQSDATIMIFNILGQKVREYSLSTMSDGTHAIVWDGLNEHGGAVAPGLYFCQLRSRGRTEMRKMLFLGAGGMLSGQSFALSGFIPNSRLETAALQYYSLVVQNNDSTQPRIVRRELKNIGVRSDTMFNITVENDDLLFCYVKVYKGAEADLYLNNTEGTHPVKLLDVICEYPSWSPDGKYLGYLKYLSNSCYLYDLETKTIVDITSDGSGCIGGPTWTSKNQIFLAYHYPPADSIRIYLMDPDGKNKKRILDTVREVFFYNDGETFIYFDKYEEIIYRKNINAYTGEFLCDLAGRFGEYVPIQGFNALSGELLIIYHNYAKDSLDRIGTFNVESGELNELLSADSGYVFFQTRYSADYKKIAFTEYRAGDQYLGVLENGIKRRLVTIPNDGPYTLFDWYPMEFSPDGRHIAYSTEVFDEMMDPFPSLYVVDCETGTIRFIDNGFWPRWKPGVRPGN